MKQLFSRMEIKEVNDNGKFVGFASIYGNRDQGGDVVVAGALTKTIQERGGKFPLFYNHRVNVGVSSVQDTPKGALTEGVINLEKQVGRDLYSDIKFFAANGQSFGMSIGYTPIPDKIERKNGTRYLREIVLHETTLTESPMNQEATVVDVKTILEDIAEWKAGRKLSAASRARLEAAMEEIRSLMAEPEQQEASGADQGDEPQKMHSALVDLKQYFSALRFN